jgi:ABC-type xylose transport system substrate-binding protein
MLTRDPGHRCPPHPTGVRTGSTYRLEWRFPVTVPHGRTRPVAILATLLTAALPAVVWAQSPSPATTSPAPSATAPQATPLWTPPAVSGPVTLLVAGLEGDTRAGAIEDAFQATLAESCPQATLDVRYGDSTESQADQASTAVAGGAGVLVIDPVDPTTAGTIVSASQAAGAKVVALGDGIIGAVPDLQVAYDGAATGSIVGAVVVQVAADAADLDLGDDATPIPSDAPVEQVMLIDGPDGDATLAAWAANVKEGLGSRATVVHEAAVTELSAAEGQRVVGEAIAALGADGFGAVITPSDAVASGVISGLLEAGLVPGDLSVTGMGGTLPGTQAIVAGDQLLTTWQPDPPAASVAAALACGQATGVGLPTGMTTTQVDNGTGEVPTVLLTGIVVTVDGSVDGTRSVEDSVVAGEAYGPDTVASICTEDLAEACDDLGLVIPSPSPAPSASAAASVEPSAGTTAAPSAPVGSPAASPAS